MREIKKQKENGNSIDLSLASMRGGNSNDDNLKFSALSFPSLAFRRTIRRNKIPVIRHKFLGYYIIIIPTLPFSISPMSILNINHFC